MKKKKPELTEAKAKVNVEAGVIKKTAETLERFIGEPVKYTDVGICQAKIREIKCLFCEGHTSEKQLQDIDTYFGILINIMLNERRAFDDAVKRMHKDIRRFSL